MKGANAEIKPEAEDMKTDGPEIKPEAMRMPKIKA